MKWYAPHMKLSAPHMKKSPKQNPFQVSKEYFRGKWQKVGFFKGNKGGITVKPV